MALLLSLPAYSCPNAGDNSQLSKLPKVLVVRTTVDKDGAETGATMFAANAQTLINTDQAASDLAAKLDEKNGVAIVPEDQGSGTAVGVGVRASWNWNYRYGGYGYYGYGYRPYYGNYGYYYGGYRYPYSYYPYYSYYSYPYRYSYYYNPYYYRYWP